jgi:type 1 fimbria pilin
LKKFVAALCMTAAVAMAPMAQAAPTHLGHFTRPPGVFIPAHQPHRVYFVVTGHRGDKQCSVTLHARTQQVDLGTSGRSDLTNMFFLHAAGAKAALAQALATNYEPTERIVCSH